jgi:hypothetical protein
MYGKIENGGLIYAPNPLTVDGKKIYNPPADVLQKNGYKKIIQTPFPQDGRHYRQAYDDGKTEIIVFWKENEADFWANADEGEEINERIRERYTESQEFSILRQKDEKPEEYAEYYAFCEECKRFVKEKKAEYTVL